MIDKLLWDTGGRFSCVHRYLTILKLKPVSAETKAKNVL